MKEVLFKPFAESRSMLIVGVCALLIMCVSAALITHSTSRRMAISQAESTALALAENMRALQRYISSTSRPVAKQLAGEERFVPELMSTTYISRHVMEMFEDANRHAYTLKYAAINARNPVNEANTAEIAFIRRTQEDPELSHESTLLSVNDRPYLRVMIRGRSLGDDCAQCHSDPKLAPKELIETYGDVRGFHRDIGKVSSAMVIQVPLGKAFAATNGITARLTFVLLVIIGLLAVGYYVIMRALITRPLSRLNESISDVIDDESRLGEHLDLPMFKPLGNLAASFNILSEKLKAERDRLESTVLDRTSELAEKTTRLVESEERLKLAIENSNKGVWDYHIHSGIIYHNLFYASILDKEDGNLEITIDDAMAYVLEEDVSRFNARLNAHLSGIAPSFDVEYRVRSDKGVIKWIHALGKTVAFDANDKPTRLTGTITDITDRKNFEEKLTNVSRNATEEREKLNSLLASLSDGVTLIDTSMRIVYQNDVAKRMFGEHIGTTCYESYHGETAVCDSCPVVKSLESGSTFSFTRNYFRSEGSIGVIEVTITPYRSADGEIIGAVEVARDVTDLVEKERALERSITKYSTLIEKSNDGIIIHGTDDRIIEVNQRMAKFTGYDREELVGMELVDLHEDQSRVDFVARRKMFYRSGNVQREITLRRKDGSPFAAEISASVITMPDGDRFVVAFIRDIRERKQIEILKTNYMTDLERKVNEEIAARRVQEQLLIQQSKMAAMGEMVGAIAHQWRQPLNALGLFIQDIETASLDGRLRDDSYVEDLITKSMRQIGYMSETIEDFRAFFRPSKLPSSFDMKRAVSDTMRIVSAQLSQHDIEIDMVAPESDEPLTVFGYNNELKQALLNIFNNAKDAIIAKRQGEHGGHIHVDITVEGGYIKTAITDTGGGIPDDVITKVFEPYFTTKGEESGTGIGLYMAQVIIENNMRGSIMVQNADGGARFTIFLPKCAPDEACTNVSGELSEDG